MYFGRTKSTRLPCHSRVCPAMGLVDVGSMPGRTVKASVLILLALSVLVCAQLTPMGSLISNDIDRHIPDAARLVRGLQIDLHETDSRETRAEKLAEKLTDRLLGAHVEHRVEKLRRRLLIDPGQMAAGDVRGSLLPEPRPKCRRMLSTYFQQCVFQPEKKEKK